MILKNLVFQEQTRRSTDRSEARTPSSIDSLLTIDLICQLSGHDNHNSRNSQKCGIRPVSFLDLDLRTVMMESAGSGLIQEHFRFIQCKGWKTS